MRQSTRAGPGTVVLIAGLGVVAVSGYAFVGLTGHVFGPEGAAPLSMLWTVSNAVGAGLFVPVEQEVARRVAAGQVLGHGFMHVFRPIAAVTVGICGVVTVAAMVGGRLLATSLFAGHGWLVGCLVAICAGFAAQHLIRGVLAGRGQFARYGVQLGVDGGLRLGGAAALAAAGVSSVVPYGLVLAAAPALSVLVTAWGPSRWSVRSAPGVAEPDSGVVLMLAPVLVSQVLSTAIIAAGPVAAMLLAEPEDAAAAAVLIGLLLVGRAPLLGFYAVQATMLPALARLVAEADWAGLRRRLSRSLAAVTAAGAVTTVAALLVGPRVVELLLGPDFTTTAGLVGLVVGAMFVYIVAAVAAQSLLAVRGHTWSALAWAGGAGAYALALLRPGDLSWRIGLAFLVSGLVTLALAVIPLCVAVDRAGTRDRRTALDPSPVRHAAGGGTVV